MSKVIDVILHQNKYGVQRFLVVDELPDLKYRRMAKDGRQVLFAEDGIFSGMFFYDKPSKGWEAFAGREFDIQMFNGTVEKAFGQWWHGISSKDVIDVGIGTPEELGKCNVFCGYEVKRDVAEQIFENFKNPSNNYDKYRKGHKNFGVNRIVSRWDAELPTDSAKEKE